MDILVIDGQGGGLGAALVKAVREKQPEAHITAVGANSAATAAMKKAGAHIAATGENAVIVACRRVDVIVGPVACAIADSLWGEITPAMAAAVGGANAKRVLVPFNHCSNVIVGVADLPVSELIRLAMAEI